MTEFEMAYLLTDMQSALANTSAVQFTLVSAACAASHFAAHKMGPLLISIALPAYSFSAFINAFMLNRMSISFVGLVRQMHAVATSGAGLKWHAAAFAIPSDWVLDVGPSALLLWSFLVYAATIFYFFRCRRVNKTAKTSSWTPGARGW